jgi:L-aspartate oxidase
MSRYAGVERDAEGLETLIALIARLERANGPALPLVAARLVAQGALERRESRGAHMRLDYPELGEAISTRLRLAQPALGLMAAE